MPVPDVINGGEQERSLPAAAPLALPASGRTLRGYFVRWNEWADIDGEFMESFAPGSIDASIAARSMKVLFDHGNDPSLGRKVLGAGHNVHDDGVGAFYEVELLEAPYVDELLPGLRAGLYGSSFRFRTLEPPRVDWAPGASPHNPDGLPEVLITKADIIEYGPTPLPCYDGSTASVRSIVVDKTPTNTPPRQESATMATDIPALLAEVDALRSRMAELDTEYADRAMPAEPQTEYDKADADIKAKLPIIEGIRSRKARLAELASLQLDDTGTDEKVPATVENERSVPNTRRPGALRTEDIWDLSQIRGSLFDDGDSVRELRERSYRAIEVSGLLPDQQERVRSLVETTPLVARHVMTHGSPQYRSAFRKTVFGLPLDGDEQRAMSLTGANGGFAEIPYQLDPTLIKTGALAINPLRGISRTVQIAGTNQWRGVSTGAVVASFDAEASAVSDDSPTFAQPSITCYPARAFVPFSFEIGEDYPGLMSDLGMLIGEAKSTLEANKFTVGTGSGEPFGIVTRATTTVTAGGTAAFAVGDLYNLDNAVPARYQANAAIMGSRAIINRVRAFDTTNGNTLFGANAALNQSTGTDVRMNASILGYPTVQNTDMAAVLTTGSKILVMGDFNQYVIVDRIGMSVEVVQNLFDTTTGRPTGQRGLLAHWRVGADTTNAAAFRTLVTG